jgi:hypothetical protein
VKTSVRLGEAIDKNKFMQLTGGHALARQLV